MGFPKNRSGRDEIMQRLGALKQNDVSWDDGKSFAHAFTADEDGKRLAEEAYNLFLWENGMDPTLFPSLLRMETEIIAAAREHLRGDEEVVGTFTSGGTESNILAMLTARNAAQAANPNITRPEAILPISAHPSFSKGAWLCGIKPVYVPINTRTFVVEPAKIEAAITDQTVMIGASAPAYAHGAIDPIEELGEIALRQKIHLHIDACIGGFVLPFWRELGGEVPNFDLSVPGVTSISMDFHKYAFAAKGASCVLYRNAAIRAHQIFCFSGWPGYTLINPTLQSSRSGGPLAGTWAMLHYYGREGYREIVAGLKDATERIVAGLAEIDGLEVLGPPAMCLVGVGSDTVNVFRLCAAMHERGWHMYPQFGLGELPATFHLTILPGNVTRVEEYLADLNAAVEEERSRPTEEPGPLMQMASQLDVSALSDAEIQGLLEGAGLGGGELPGGQEAEINDVLNALSPEARDRILTVYVNRLYRD